MTHEHAPHEMSSGPLNIRPDVIKMFSERAFMTFDDVYDRLVALKTDYVLVILTDSIRYSSDKQEQHAFVAGILHTLSIQLVSLEFDSLEASLMSMHTIVDDDGEGQPRSDEPDDDPPTA